MGSSCFLESCHFYGVLEVPFVVLVSAEDPVFEPLCISESGDFWYMQSEEHVQESLGTNSEPPSVVHTFPCQNLALRIFMGLKLIPSSQDKGGFSEVDSVII